MKIFSGSAIEGRLGPEFGSPVRENTELAEATEGLPHSISPAGIRGETGKRQPPIVCLLDDDPSVLKATARLLDSDDRTVRSFTDPKAFLEFARAEKPEVAVIDIWMPQMNGLEVQQVLRDISPSTRVIVLTSRDDSIVRERALAGGAYAFFMKGVPPPELLAAVAGATTR